MSQQQGMSSGSEGDARRRGSSRRPSQGDRGATSRQAGRSGASRHGDAARRPSARSTSGATPTARHTGTRTRSVPLGDARTAGASSRRSTRQNQSYAPRGGGARGRSTRTRRDAGTAGRSRTTNKPFTTRVPPSARARTNRRAQEAARRRRYIELGLVALVGVLSLVLVVFAIRGVVGFVGGLFSGGSKAPKVEEQTATEPAPQGEDVTINLVMIGDILQHSGVFSSGYLDDGTRNYDHVFAHIGSEIEGADIKVVNQETILGGTAFEFSGYPSFNGPQEMGDAEVKAGFNVVLRATNHALDYSYEGLQSELNYWKTSHPEVAVIGAQDPSDPSTSIDDVYVFEKDGFKVALLNYTYGTNDIPDPQGAVSTLDEEHVRTTLQKAEELADMVVVFPHWGEEYCLEPIEDQYKMATFMMDNGADVIIGGHPHVIEPVEVLTASDGHKVPCFWSVGNFISTQVDDQNLIGGVAKVTMHKAADGTCSVDAASFVPTVTHKGLGANMTTYLLRDYTDELASSNYLESNYTDNTTLTVAWANTFCTQVLGPNFDTTSEQISFGPEAFVAGAPQETAAPAEGDGATATGEAAGEGAGGAAVDAAELDEAA